MGSIAGLKDNRGGGTPEKEQGRGDVEGEPWDH